MSSHKKLLIVDVAALGWDLVCKEPSVSNRWVFQKVETVFPAVTCTVQASFRTATLPKKHGMVANGLFFRELRKVMFWEQATVLVKGERIWENFRKSGKRVGIMFWQQSLGEEADLILSPAPIHKHGGGMIQDCYSRPHNLYERLVHIIGRPFNLMHYWGPLASRKSSDWIVDATMTVMETPDLAPDLLLSYLPHLDYDLQRHGPDSRKASQALQVMCDYLDRLQTHAKIHDYDFLFFGDYAVHPVPKGAIFPNCCLREAGLFVPRPVRKRTYVDFFSNPAFAMVDHEIAHVFARDERAAREAKGIFAKLPGVGAILDQSAQRQPGVDHPHSGELILVAEKGYWFAYPWWKDKKEAPDYATHVDIHNKPGYDPCELFFGWPLWSVSSDTARVRGSHGRGGPENCVAWSSSCNFDPKPTTLIDLAQAIKNRLEAE